jgi:hypothetical protein
MLATGNSPGPPAAEDLFDNIINDDKTFRSDHLCDIGAWQLQLNAACRQLLRFVLATAAVDSRCAGTVVEVGKLFLQVDAFEILLIGPVPFGALLAVPFDFAVGQSASLLPIL